MKAKVVNGKIKIYNKLPKDYVVDGTSIVNFNKLTDLELQVYDFYNVVTPKYDSITQQISNLHFVEEESIFTYDVKNIVFSQTLEEAKENKKLEVKKIANNLLQPTDWYIIRFAERKVEIPTEVEKERQSILINSGEAENAINALKTIPEVLKYQIKLVNDILEDIEPLGEQSI